MPHPRDIDQALTWQNQEDTPVVRLCTPGEHPRRTFGEDAAASRTGSGPANLATIRAAITAAIKDAGYLHIPEGRRDHTTPAETLHLHDRD